MKKTIYLIIAVIVVVAVLTSLFFFRTSPPQNQQFIYGFEDGFNGWEPDSHLPPQVVDWNVTVVGNVSSTGTKSVLLHVDGLQDDGTIWIERKLTIAPNVTKNVNVTFSFWSESESFNTIAVVVGYVGDKNPEVEEDFQVLGAANQVQGWKTYTVSSQVETDSSGDVYVALGLSVRWETLMTYYIDDVTITIN